MAAEQEELDREAPALERRLRAVMGSGLPEEEALMRRWFQLVSRRNALVHRAYQLSIMQVTPSCFLRNRTKIRHTQFCWFKGKRSPIWSERQPFLTPS